jgi:hypothetical protein
MGKIFKARLTDGPRRVTHDSELAQRTAVAHFPGQNVRAGRDGVDEDETLKIYREVTKNGLPTEEHIGHFIGTAFSAEAGPKGLTVYHYAGGGGGIPISAIGDRRSRGPMTAARLQAQIVEHRLVRNDR